MKSNRILLLILLLSFYQFSGAQTIVSNCPSSNGEANVWYFGGYAGLDFNTKPPVALTNNSSLQSLEGNACICDSIGNFVMALSGSTKIEVFNNQLQRQTQITGIGGSVSATQPGIIIPRPDHNYLYEVFMLNLPINHPGYENGLVHSIIDASDPSSPKLLKQADTLLSKVSEGISAVLHQNQVDVWILVHEWESDAFLAYLVGSEGLLNDHDPVRSICGSYRGGESNNAIGIIKFSPDGTKAAYTFYKKGIVELFDFDNESGELSLISSSPADYEAIYGCEFSANSSKLYISTTHLDIPDDFISRIYQFDLDKGVNWFESPWEVAINDSKGYFCGMQLAVDGKIYVARSPQYHLYLGIVQNPDRVGEASNFNRIDNNANSGLRLAEKVSKYGLPNFNQSYFNKSSFTYEMNCYRDSTRFNILNLTNVDSVKWDFNDGGISRETNPIHHFSAPGMYMVELQKYFNGSEFTSTSEIKINPLPNVEINAGKDTVLVFVGNKARLEIDPIFIYQQWNDGTTNHYIEVSEPGYYWVEASDQNCCVKTDTVFVKEIRIFIPTAFIPESTGQDATFAVVDMDNSIIDMELIIYDRWGKQVKVLTNKFESWDGKGYQSGVYFYTIEASMIDGTNFTNNGNITLLR